MPAPLLFVCGGQSMYFGVGGRRLLFDELEPASAAWPRQFGAAVVPLAWL